MCSVYDCYLQECQYRWRICWWVARNNQIFCLSCAKKSKKGTSNSYKSIQHSFSLKISQFIYVSLCSQYSDIWYLLSEHIFCDSEICFHSFLIHICWDNLRNQKQGLVLIIPFKMTTKNKNSTKWILVVSTIIKYELDNVLHIQVLAHLSTKWLWWAILAPRL